MQTELEAKAGERQAQVKALRELADYLEEGSELPQAAEGAVRRIVALRQGLADVREWQEAKERGTAKSIVTKEG